MLTREDHGAASGTLPSPVSPTVWVWAMSGGSPIFALKMEEVNNFFSHFCTLFYEVKVNFNAGALIVQMAAIKFHCCKKC